MPPSRGNLPLSRHCLILATQAGPWRALPVLYVPMCLCVCMSVWFWTCICAHFLMYQDWQVKQFRQRVSFFLFSLVSFLFFRYEWSDRWIINEKGNFCSTLDPPTLQDVSLKEATHETAKIHTLSSPKCISHLGIGVVWELQIFLDIDSYFP